METRLLDDCDKHQSLELAMESNTGSYIAPRSLSGMAAAANNHPNFLQIFEAQDGPVSILNSFLGPSETINFSSTRKCFRYLYNTPTFANEITAVVQQIEKEICSHRIQGNLFLLMGILISIGGLTASAVTLTDSIMNKQELWVN